MKKLIILFMILLIILFAACAATRSDSQAQSACQKVVEDFTGKPVEFVKKINTDEENPALKIRFQGFYVFDDELYEYVVNPDKLYICNINTVSKEARQLLKNGDAVTEETATRIAKEIFKKIECKFLIENSEISTEVKTHGDTSSFYDIEITETINGLPTGNCASMSVSKTRNLLSVLFLTGDLPNIESLKKDKDKMITSEKAVQIAIDKIKAMPELDAENIMLDDTEAIELITWKDTTVWRVHITYDKRGESTMVCRGAVVPVDVFSGEVVADGVGLY